MNIGAIFSHRRLPLFKTLQDQSGVAAIETALVLPVLLLLGLGGMELANYVLTHAKISQMGLNAADNASRIAGDTTLALPHVRQADLTELFTAIDLQSPKLDFMNKGRIILSSLEQNSSGGQWIRWQKCYGNLNKRSDYGPAGTGASGTNFAGMGPTGNELKAPDDAAIMFVEIYYEYRPSIFPSLFGTRDIRYTAAFNVREARDYASGVNLGGTSDRYPCPN